MRKSDFVEWQAMEVTQEVLTVIKDRIAELSEGLVKSAGMDPIYDRYRAGVILGLQQILEIEYREEEKAGDA